MFALIGSVCGCFLFWLREWKKWLYAVIEIWFGLISLYDAAPVFVGDFDAGDFSGDMGGAATVAKVTVVGAIYLIVRGLDNWDKAMTKAPCWEWFRAKIGIPRL